jgi:hypothetical protein
METLNHTDLFNKESPIQCYKLKIISGYYVVVLILALIFNWLLLREFFLNKKLRTSINLITIALTFCNLIGSIGGMTFAIWSNFRCRLIFLNQQPFHIFSKRII